MGKSTAKQNSAKPVNYSLDSQKITFDFLKAHLWGEADILRGSLDPSEYRQPVMTLLFLKRLNDTFEEKAEQLIKQGKSEKDAWENKNRHNFFIPKNARWKVLSSISAMCKMNMVLHNVLDFRIEYGDILSNPKLVEGGKLKKYDRVLANFPFSMDWDSRVASKDPYNRFRFGIPPEKDKADFAFIEHMFASLNDKGQAAIICSQGVLFRGNEETKIRENGQEKERKKLGFTTTSNLLFSKHY